MSKPKKKPNTLPPEQKPDQTKILRRIVAPVLRLKFDKALEITILDSEIGGKRAGKYLLPAFDRATSSHVHVALPPDVVAILENAYPARAYLGRSFRVIKHRYISESRAYSKRAAYTVDEIEFQPSIRAEHAAVESLRRLKGSEIRLKGSEIKGL